MKEKPTDQFPVAVYEEAAAKQFNSYIRGSKP